MAFSAIDIAAEVDDTGRSVARRIRYRGMACGNAASGIAAGRAGVAAECPLVFMPLRYFRHSSIQRHAADD